jgi:hypothetical protein
MSKARQSGKSGLEVFADTVKTASCQGPAPVHLWNPPDCGDIDMRIAADGTWFYHGSPIGRPALVKLFASILKREGDKFYLVTPVEKCGIVVDDVPFMAVELHVQEGDAGRELRLRTNVGDWLTCGPGHPLRFEEEAATGGLKPYVHVRSGLWAKLTRPLWFELVELGEARDIGGTETFGVVSAGEFYAMAPASSVEDVGSSRTLP